jgi:flagellar basal-body rod modification protein FlgD
MQLSSVDPNTTPSTSTATGNSRLGKDEFVKLMMAQLSHQDPTAPQSNEAFVAQLAQFASVELAQTTNANLEALIVAQAASNQTGVAQLVGKDVVFRTDQIAVGDDGAITEMNATLPKEAGNVVVSIKDASGNVVRTMQMGAQHAGKLDIPWDGCDDAGLELPPGNYTFSVSATGTDGAVMDDIVVGVRGHVDGVSFANGAPELIIGSLKIPLGDVVEIAEASEPSEQENP